MGIKQLLGGKVCPFSNAAIGTANVYPVCTNDTTLCKTRIEIWHISQYQNPAIFGMPDIFSGP